jgi:hypothetical protein
MADPSMDKQELHVAASRSREETFIYATPEIHAHREEIAPESPPLREGIPHVAEAVERDRNTQKRIEQAREHLDRFDSQREAAQGLRCRQRDADLARVDVSEANTHKAVAPRSRGAGDARHRAGRAPRAGSRRSGSRPAVELTIIAARISPPAYVKSELGERPSDPAKRQAWDRGVAGIERYRQERGIKDPSKAFVREAKRRTERGGQQAARGGCKRFSDGRHPLRGSGASALGCHPYGAGLRVG